MSPPPQSEPRINARILTFLIAFGCMLGGCNREVRDTDIKLISVAVVKDRIDRQARGEETDLIILIDPRPRKYYEQSHIPGARHLTLGQVDPRSKVDSSIDRYQTIVVYGDDPANAEARGMTKRLMAVGYSGVRWFAGGLYGRTADGEPIGWVPRGYPVEGTGTPSPAPSTPSPEPATQPAPAAPTGRPS